MSSGYHLAYFPGPVAEKFHADHTSEAKLLIGPFGTGKTTSAAYDVIMCASKRVRPDRSGIKRSRFAVVRNTIPQLKDTTIKTVLDWFPPLAFGEYKMTDKQFTIRQENRIIEVLFRALDDDQDVRNLLSLELTGAWVDEAREVSHSIILGLIGRMKRYPSKKAYPKGVEPYHTVPQILFTTNYPSREHWLYESFVSKAMQGWTIYEQTQEENKHNLSTGYYETLEKTYANRPDLLRTLVLGEWGITVKGKEVYPEFVRKLHVSPKPLLPDILQELREDSVITRGWDNTGLTPACIVTYINNCGQWLPFKEFSEEDMGIVEFGEMVNQWCKERLPTGIRYRDIGDPAGKNRDSTKTSPAQYLLKECGIKIEDGIQTFKVRRESVAGRLTKLINGQPAMVIDPSCTRLIDGFEGGYAYKEYGSSGVFNTAPMKNEYSHIHDSLAYIASRLFYSESGRKAAVPVSQTLGKYSFKGNWR